MAEWISVDDRMPEKPYGCLLVVWDSTPTGEGDDFLNYLPYFAGWDGEQWNDSDGERVPFEVAYWMPLPVLPKENANNITDYSKIVKALKHDAVFAYLGEGDDGKRIAQLMYDAANAIDALQKELLDLKARTCGVCKAQKEAT